MTKTKKDKEELYGLTQYLKEQEEECETFRIKNKKFS